MLTDKQEGRAEIIQLDFGPTIQAEAPRIYSHSIMYACEHCFEVRSDNISLEEHYFNEHFVQSSTQQGGCLSL